MSYTDKTLTCRDCGIGFTFTASEQEFYAGKGFTNEPGRCPECRATRKAQRNGSGGYASYGGDRDYSGGRDTGGPREMHTATCAECGADARVPFVPRGDRPVYCSSCFDRVRGTRSSYR